MNSLKPRNNGVLTIEQVKDRIERAVLEEIVCHDCGGYGSDHDRNDGFCNDCALYDRIDSVVETIMNVLTVNSSLGVRCNNNKHLISQNYCVECKAETISARRLVKQT